MEKIFPDCILGQFDIYYPREGKKLNKILPENFLET